MSEHAERLEPRAVSLPMPASGDLLGILEQRVQHLVVRQQTVNETERDLRGQIEDRDRLIRELSGKLEALDKLRAEAAARVDRLIEQVDQLAQVRA